MTQPILNIKKLSYFSSDGVIENINLKINKKEIHALVSNNRTEQKLFLQAITDLKNSNIEGEIIYKQKDLRKEQNTSLQNLEITILRQYPALMQNLSIAENLYFKKLPKRKFSFFINWKKVKENSRKFLNEFGLQLNVLQKVNSLSEENKRMVYIASQFIQKPKLVIMHEPLEGLSARNTAIVYKLLKRFIKQGGSVLYITRQWEEALNLSNQISIMTNGTIVDRMSTETAKMDPERMLKGLNGYRFSRTSDMDNDAKSLLDAVLQSAELLTSENELKDVLYLLAKESTNFMNADGCHIKLIDESTWSIIDGLEFNQKKHVRAELEEDVIKEIAKGTDIFYANENDKIFESLFKLKAHVKTIVSIPILIRSSVSGVILFYYEDFYVYSNNESKYLEGLTRHIAFAIEETRLMGRSALLKESHHRIKNNLQSIIAIISLQRHFIESASTQSMNDILDDIIARIKSISTVHDLLSKDDLGRSIVNLKDLIKKIASQYNYPSQFKIELDLDDIFIPYNRATSIALVINELVTNSFKHGFKGFESGVVKIKCKTYENQTFISVKDNGHGLPDGFNPTKSANLGLSILQGIVKSEFKGEIAFITDHGTTIEIKIPSTSFSVNQFL